MPLKCVTGGLLFRTSNDLDWHIREEHLQRETPPAKGAPVAAPAPVVGGTDQADRPPPPADGGPSQARPRWSLPLARGGAGCSAGGHRNPRRGRVAESLAPDPCPRAAFELRQPADVVLWRWDSTAVRTSARS
jgi:hypothetical protein